MRAKMNRTKKKVSKKRNVVCLLTRHFSATYYIGCQPSVKNNCQLFSLCCYSILCCSDKQQHQQLQLASNKKSIREREKKRFRNENQI